MDNYMDFKREYLRLLTQMLNEPKGDGPLIGTRASAQLADALGAMEEKHPVWTERVEDWLAERHQLQGETSFVYL